MAINFDKYNEAVQSWGVGTRSLLQATGRSLGILHRSNSPSKGASLSKLKDRYRKDSSGAINRVTIGNINRSLIYTSVGAGKGIGGTKGSRWIDKFGNRKKTNPRSMGKLGTSDRTPKDFINKTLDSNEGIEALADIVAVHQADAVIDSVYKN